MSAENEEDYDELPSIIVNSSTRDSCTFVMPSAEVLASQRAREQNCELELQALRGTELKSDEDMLVRMSHSDSSGSEGEAALAAAVCGLRVHSTSSPAPRPNVAALLTAVRDQLPPDTNATFIEEYLKVLANNDKHATVIVTDEIMSNISSMLVCDDNEWSDEEVMCVGAWLCAACVAAPGRRNGAARALHVLLDDRASTAQVTSLGELLGRAWRDSDVRAEAADAARAGGCRGRGEGGALLADMLVRTALADILRDDMQPNELTAVSLGELPALVTGAWRRLDAAARLALVRLLGRALVGASEGEEESGGGEEVRAVLDALTAQRAPAAHRYTPDHLQVLVGASKLQLLFGTKKQCGIDSSL